MANVSMPVHSTTATARGCATLTMPWHTWEPRPVAGDLVVVLSTRPLIQVPWDWVAATSQVAYVLYHPGTPEPQFTSEDDGVEWEIRGYIAYPEAAS